MDKKENKPVSLKGKAADRILPTTTTTTPQNAGPSTVPTQTANTTTTTTGPQDDARVATTTNAPSCSTSCSSSSSDLSAGQIPLTSRLLRECHSNQTTIGPMTCREMVAAAERLMREQERLVYPRGPPPPHPDRRRHINILRPRLGGVRDRIKDKLRRCCSVVKYKLRRCCGVM